MRTSTPLIEAANAALHLAGPSRRTLAWSARSLSTSTSNQLASTRCSRCPANQDDISAYTTYVMPPSNTELDPVGVDSGLFEEEALPDYKHTKSTLAELTKIRSGSKSTPAQKKGKAVEPSDALADLISKGDLVRATQVLIEFQKLQTFLGQPKIEYLQAALGCLESPNPELAKPSTALRWIRLAPAMRTLQTRPKREQALVKALVRQCTAVLAKRDRGNLEARTSFRYLLKICRDKGYADALYHQTLRSIRLNVDLRIRDGRGPISENLETGNYQTAFQKHAEIYGTSRRAGIDSAFLAMVLLDPVILKQASRRSEYFDGSQGKEAHDNDTLEQSTASTVPRRDLGVPTSVPASIQAQVHQHASPSGRPLLTRLGLADARQALQIAIRACEWDPDQLSRVYKLWYGLVTEPYPLQVGTLQGEKNRQEAMQLFDSRGARAIKATANADPSDLLDIFGDFLNAFMVQQGRYGSSGLSWLSKRRQRMDVEEKRIFHLRHLADQTCALRILRIFKDIRRTVELGEPPIAMWNKLLRALGQKGPKYWESKTVVIARAMKMLPDEGSTPKPEESPSAEADAASAGPHQDGSTESNNDTSMPELLRQIGSPPLANQESFDELVGAISRCYPFMNRNKYRGKRAETMPLMRWAQSRKQELKEGWEAWRKCYSLGEVHLSKEQQNVSESGSKRSKFRNITDRSTISSWSDEPWRSSASNGADRSTSDAGADQSDVSSPKAISSRRLQRSTIRARRVRLADGKVMREEQRPPRIAARTL
ncbi:hypothetical protein OC846_000551 [Tilletia horrida]|uniref:Uncharacterized protein n=1 Tax=Tilletia horrida TaxID=155126 RepID=A0AAN6K0T1_9BASI|nr:hypothetical protein OC846_000551 [Tilletia horrida]